MLIVCVARQKSIRLEERYCASFNWRVAKATEEMTQFYHNFLQWNQIQIDESWKS